MKHFKAIAAMAQNRVIGNSGQIPWHLPDDFKWFKRMTTGHILVMGRKTFESIGKPLPGRETIVLSRSRSEITGARVVANLSELDPASEVREMFICGGSEVYAISLPVCSDLYLTRVKKIVEGDTFFPPFEHLFRLHDVVLDSPEFVIEHHRNSRL
jgi:dihydrofolate reductase